MIQTEYLLTFGRQEQVFIVTFTDEPTYTDILVHRI